MKEIMIRSSIVVLILAFIAVAAGAVDQDMFEVFPLEVEGEILNHLAGDFNGDKLTDILIIYLSGGNNASRFAGLFLQKAGAGFRSRADFLTPLPADINQVDAADIDGDGLTELLLLHPNGVNFMKFTAAGGLGAPVNLIQEKSAFAAMQFHGIMAGPLQFEIMSAPGPELLIPTDSGFSLYAKDGDGRYSKTTNLKTHVFCKNVSRTTRDLAQGRPSGITLEPPRIYMLDGNTDGLADIYFLWDHKVAAFFQEARNGFSENPAMEISFSNDPDDGYRQSRLCDYNGDRKIDAVVSHTSGGFTNAETTLRFYAADASGKISAVSSGEIRLSDSHCNLMVDDFDGDNRPEFAMTAVEMGAIAASKMFLLKKTDLNLLIYPAGAGIPRPEPQKRTSFEIRFDFEAANPTEGIHLDWSADFNADKLHDAVLCDGNGRILFYWGARNEYLSRRPDLEVTLDHPACVRPIHLNSGGLADLLVEHNLTGRLDHLTILKNKQNRL